MWRFLHLANLNWWNEFSQSNSDLVDQGKGLELLPKHFCNHLNEGNKNSIHRSNILFGDKDFSSKAWKYFLATEPVSFPDKSFR